MVSIFIVRQLAEQHQCTMTHYCVARYMHTVIPFGVCWTVFGMLADVCKFTVCWLVRVVRVSNGGVPAS